jgi:hypothetical protein
MRKKTGMRFYIVGVILFEFSIITLASCDVSNDLIQLSQQGTYTFPSATVGYDVQTPLEVVVKTSDFSSFTMKTSLSGSNASAFHVVGGGSYLPAIVHQFTIEPITGLSIGTYTAKVTVTVTTKSGRESKSFDVSFTVE